MELLNFEKETSEQGKLRLVAENKEPQSFPLIEKQFVNFMFFRVNPEWRKLNSRNQAGFQKRISEHLQQIRQGTFAVQLFAGRV